MKLVKLRGNGAFNECNSFCGLVAANVHPLETFRPPPPSSSPPQPPYEAKKNQIHHSKLPVKLEIRSIHLRSKRFVWWLRAERGIGRHLSASIGVVCCGFDCVKCPFEPGIWNRVIPANGMPEIVRVFDSNRRRKYHKQLEPNPFRLKLIGSLNYRFFSPGTISIDISQC